MESKIQIGCRRVAYVLLIVSSLFALYTSGFGLLSAMAQRSIHWLFMIVCIFLLYPIKKGKNINVLDIALAAVSALATLYVVFTWQRNALRIADPAVWEIALCVIGVLLVLEATRRTMGMAMPSLPSLRWPTPSSARIFPAR